MWSNEEGAVTQTDEHQGYWRIINKEELVRLWGHVKSNPNMDYEKMAKNLRCNATVTKGNRAKGNKHFVFKFQEKFLLKMEFEEQLENMPEPRTRSAGFQ